jgi:hypothetical protein
MKHKAGTMKVINFFKLLPNSGIRSPHMINKIPGCIIILFIIIVVLSF